MEVGLHFSDTNILVLASGHKHSAPNASAGMKVEKQAWTVDQKLTQ